MKWLLSILLFVMSLQGFSQPGFTGYTTKNTFRGLLATQNLGFPADTFAVTGSLKNYRWAAIRRDTIWLWSQPQNKWVKSLGGGQSNDNFSLPLQRVSNLVGIKGITTVGLAGQVPISNGTQWEYHYPFNHDSASRYSFETKGKLIVISGGANLDTLADNGTEVTNYIEKTSAYSILTTDHTINCTSGTFTITLPPAAGNVGQTFVIKNTGAGVITVDGFGSETIDGGPSYTLSTSGKYVQVKSGGGTKYIVTSNN